MFTPKVVQSVERTTPIGRRHKVWLPPFEGRDLILLQFSESVRLPVGWRRHGRTGWRIMNSKDRYVIATTVDRVSLAISIAVIERRSFDDRRPFVPARRMLAAKVKDRLFADQQLAMAQEPVRIRAPEYGARVLVKLTDHVNPDPDADRQGAYKTGYAVNVRALNEPDGLRENKRAWIQAGRDPAAYPGKLGVIRLPAINPKDLDTFSYPQSVDDQGNALPDAGGTPIHRRRDWWFEWNRLSVAVRNDILNKGEATLSYADARDFMRRIRDRAQYRDVD